MIFRFINSLDRPIGRVSSRTYRLRTRGTRPKRIMRVVHSKKPLKKNLRSSGHGRGYREVSIVVVVGLSLPAIILLYITYYTYGDA